MRKLIHDSRGQGIVEFALIFPLFAMLLFIVVDGGLAMGRYNTANQAAAVGARIAAVTGGDFDDVDDAVQPALRAQMHDLLGTANCNQSGGDICIDFRTGPNGEASGEVGSIVVVHVRYQYDLIAPVGGVLSLLGVSSPDVDAWVIKACSVQRVERRVVNAASDDDDISECT